MAAALIKLTTLVEDLRASKGSKGSRLEQALDTGGGGGEGSGALARIPWLAERSGKLFTKAPRRSTKGSSA